MDGEARIWVVEWRVSVRSRLEGTREVVLARFARTAGGASATAREAVGHAVDGEVRIRIDSGMRTMRRPAIVADAKAVAMWDADATDLPARFWRSRWVEADRAANARTLIGIDFEDAARRCVHARLLDDEGAAALIAAIDAALDAHAETSIRTAA